MLSKIRQGVIIHCLSGISPHEVNPEITKASRQTLANEAFKAARAYGRLRKNFVENMARRASQAETSTRYAACSYAGSGNGAA